MVHALEEIRHLLKPDGCLIDIHPIRKATLIEIHRGSNLLFTESDPGYDSHDRLRHADAALDEVIQRGLYLIEGKSEFELITYATSVSELRDFQAKIEAYDDSPQDEAVTALQDEVYTRVNEIMRAAGEEAEIAYLEKARITRLKPKAK